MNLVERTLGYLQSRRNKILEGGINSIPSPFVRFSNDFIGIEQKKYYIVTGNQKSGKTQFASYVFLYTPLLYAYHNPEKARIKVFYYALEESPEDVLERFMTFLLHYLSKGQLRISTTDLQSSKNRAINQEILDKLQDGEYINLLNFFEEHVVFPKARNPTGVWNDVKKYREETGTIHTRKQKIKRDNGTTGEINVFDYYEPNDPDEYVIMFFDHLSLIHEESGMSKKQTADKLSEYCVDLRNDYAVTSVIIQQQTAEMESLDAFKNAKLRPTASGLADTKYTSRDCNVLLGIFNPAKHELPDYKGYDITKIKENIRFLEVILNRGGSAGGLIALFFDGATCNWWELPRPEDKGKMQRVYNYIKSLSQSKDITSLTLLTVTKWVKRLHI